MIRTCKQLESKLNEVNNTIDIKVVKEHGYYIIKQGGYESEFTYTLKELVNEVAVGNISMKYNRWTMSGEKVKTIKGIE